MLTISKISSSNLGPYQIHCAKILHWKIFVSASLIKETFSVYFVLPSKSKLFVAMNNKEIAVSITLPETVQVFRNLKTAKRFAIDIGKFWIIQRHYHDSSIVQLKNSWFLSSLILFCRWITN